MCGVRIVAGTAAAVLVLATIGLGPASADTIDAALVRAYQDNPQLNAQRAQVRFTDENVPQALSGYRPASRSPPAPAASTSIPRPRRAATPTISSRPTFTASTRRAASARR